MKINWGSGIAIFYTLFVVVMILMVVKSSQNKPRMVQKNYYEKDLNYEAFRQKRENGDKVKDLIDIQYQAGLNKVKISFPGNLQNIEGNVVMFRPSNEYLDKSYPLKLDSMGDMFIPLDKNTARGQWKLQIDWTTSDQEYYNEEVIII